MGKNKNLREQSVREARKLRNPNTRHKNAGGQTQGQWEHDPARRTGYFTGAGEAPLMKK